MRRYRPNPPPRDDRSLQQYVFDEFTKLGLVLDTVEEMEILYVAPSKPQTGQRVFADGTNWDPGQGAGVYVWDGTRWAPETNGVVWDDLRVAASTGKAGVTKAPGFEKFRDNGSGSVGVFAYRFDASSEEEIFFEVQLPHSYKTGTNLRPHVHWCPVTASTQVVLWGLEYTMAAIGDTLPTTNIIYATATASGTPFKHQIAGFPEIVGSSLGISSMMSCRLFRAASAGPDTLGSDAVLLEWDLHHQIDAPGSQLEYQKWAT